MKKLVDNLNLMRSLGLIKGLGFLIARIKFNPTKLEKNVKRDIAFQLGIKKHRIQNKIFRIARYTTTFALLGIFVSSMFSMPGDTFHAVKQKTEDARAVVQPSFKEELKLIRESQNNITKQSEPESDWSRQDSFKENSNNSDGSHNEDDNSESRSDSSGNRDKSNHNNDVDREDD